jgi:hypothetical protein
MGNKTLSIVFACVIAGMLGAQAAACAGSLPVYDIDGACSAYVIRLETNRANDAEAPSSREIKDCVLVEQRAYDILKTEWEALRPVTTAPCLLEAAKQMSGSYYSALYTCIRGRILHDMFPGGYGP